MNLIHFKAYSISIRSCGHLETRESAPFPSDTAPSISLFLSFPALPVRRFREIHPTPPLRPARPWAVNELRPVLTIRKMRFPPPLRSEREIGGKNVHGRRLGPARSINPDVPPFKTSHNTSSSSVSAFLHLSAIKYHFTGSRNLLSESVSSRTVKDFFPLCSRPPGGIRFGNDRAFFFCGPEKKGAETRAYVAAAVVGEGVQPTEMAESPRNINPF